MHNNKALNLDILPADDGAPTVVRTLTLLSSSRLLEASLRQHLECSPFRLIANPVQVQADCCLTLLDLSVDTPDGHAWALRDLRHLPLALVNVRKKAARELLCAHPWIRGVFYPSTSSTHFLRGIQALAAGGDWLPRELMGELVGRYRQLAQMDEQIGTLTVRERQVLSLAGQGLSNSAIAERIHLSVHTVKSHIHNGLLKLGASNRAQGAALVLGHGEGFAS